MREVVIPAKSFVLETERHAGAHTAALLAGQTPDVLRAMREQLEESIRPFARGDGYALPMAAYVVAMGASAHLPLSGSEG